MKQERSCDLRGRGTASRKGLRTVYDKDLGRMWVQVADETFKEEEESYYLVACLTDMEARTVSNKVTLYLQPAYLCYHVHKIFVFTLFKYLMYSISFSIKKCLPSKCLDHGI